MEEIKDEKDNLKEESRLDSLQKNLYSRKKEQIVSRARRHLKERDFGARDSWKEEKEGKIMKGKRSVIRIVLLASLAFFAFSVVYAIYVWIDPIPISTENIIVEVQGPAQIGGGEELALQISVLNQNPVPIEGVKLIIEYPEGTRSPKNIDVDLARYRESLGTIDSNDSIKRNVEAVLFGEENSTKSINIIVEYRVSGSNAIFVANSNYELVLASSPLSLVIEALDETVSGQDLGFKVTVKSNSGTAVKDAMLEVEYPFGFSFEESTPESFFANKIWYLGDIPPEEEVEVIFKGMLSGQDGEERVFRFATGLQSKSDENKIGAKFINTSRSVFIKRPFIDLDLKLTGDTPDGFAVTKGGNPVRGTILWQNNLASQIFDVEIDVEFSGTAVDEKTIVAERGFYRSIDDKIIYTVETERALGSIPSGGQGSVGFTFNPLSFSSGIPLRNPTVDLDVTVRAKRLSDDNVPEEIISTLFKQVKVSSDLVLTSKLLHHTGPFINTGPIPPKAEVETTYTAILSVENSSNQVANGTVVLTLPPYVEWVGNISPLTEQISFSTVGGRIIWSLGEIAAGTGTARPLREIAFQLKFLPSITQIGKTPVIINKQSITGFDRFTEVTLESSAPYLTTRLNESVSDSKTPGRVVE
jgi:hypothetical protein